jgi:hypothetical protein
MNFKDKTLLNGNQFMLNINSLTIYKQNIFKFKINLINHYYLFFLTVSHVSSIDSFLCIYDFDIQR